MGVAWGVRAVGGVGAFGVAWVVAACAGRSSEAGAAPALASATVAVPRPVAVAGGDDGPALGKPDAGPPVDPELAWLRGRVPSLAGLHADTSVDALLAWVPEGTEAQLWVTADKYRCAAATATQVEGGDRLSLLIVDSESHTGGKHTRELMGAYAGRLLTYGSNGRRQRQRADGSWVSDGGWGRSGGSVAGALGEVSAERASYAGRPVHLQLTCPDVEIPCASGGSRFCRDCAAFEVHVHILTSLHGGFGMRGAARRPATCSDPCPPNDRTDMDRARGIIASLKTPWLQQTDVAPTALYRSLALCTSELPPTK